MEYIAIILFCFLVALAIILFVALRGWTDFDYVAVIRSGSAIISWVVHLAFEFLWAVVPVVFGALAGWLIRRRYCAHDNAA
jgi:ABC-type sulfate transport system permease component